MNLFLFYVLIITSFYFIIIFTLRKLLGFKITKNKYINTFFYFIILYFLTFILILNLNAIINIHTSGILNPLHDLFDITHNNVPGKN